MALNLPDNPGLCDAMAQAQGALAYVDGKCVPVSGKQIQIEETENSVMEGFEITNFNFHCQGAQPPMPTTDFLPGPVGDTQKTDIA